MEKVTNRAHTSSLASLFIFFFTGYCTGIDGNWECECYDGYFGDCQSSTCPKGLAWWHEPVVDNIAHDEYIECSNMGLCDRNTGRCLCREGFEGNACERMSCNQENEDLSTCNNSGRCLSMRSLALQRKNAYLENDPVSYGYYSSSPYTWDADMVYACYGDEYGYVDDEYGHHNITQRVGYNLTESQCPYGKADRYTDVVYGIQANYTNSPEIQLLKCEASSGYFQVSFRDEASDYIEYNSTIYEFTKKLHSIRTLGQVKVQWYLSDTIGDVNTEGICSTIYDRTVGISLLSEIGNVPMLEIIKDKLYGNVGVTRYQARYTPFSYICFLSHSLTPFLPALDGCMNAATEAYATEEPENVNVFQIGEVRTEWAGLVNGRTAGTT